VAYMMIYIKSTLVGLVTLFAATVLYLVGTIVVFIRSYQPPAGGMVRITSALTRNDRPVLARGVHPPLI